MVSCTLVSRVLELEGRKQTVSGSEVVCADTVLFPEGGGQNTDRGTISDVPVLSVSRRGTEAVHLVSPPVSWSPGTVVRQRLDWGRRWDNMQQHSGQHLVSAVLVQRCDHRGHSRHRPDLQCWRPSVGLRPHQGPS